MATGAEAGGWFGATFGALVTGLTKDEAGSAREQPPTFGALFGGAIRAGDDDDARRRGRRKVWRRRGTGGGGGGGGGEEGGEDYDELMDAEGSEIPDEEVRSVRSARSIPGGLRHEPVNDDEEAGSAVRDLGEGHRAPLGPFKERPRSRTEQALPLGIEQAFRLLKEQLWGKTATGVHRNTRKGIRKEWNARYANALQERQRHTRGTKLLCSPEALNGLVVPLVCFILFLLQILMSTIFSSK